MTVSLPPNPFRYRGYYYDTETGLYYLQSRYYNPEWGRFISADVPETLFDIGYFDNVNLFLYCGNNPIMYYDPEGYSRRLTLQQYFNSIYGEFTQPYSANIRVVVKDNTVTIHARLNPSGIYGRGRAGKDSINGRYYSALIQAAIREYWSGTFTHDGITFTLKTIVSYSRSNGIKTNLYNSFGISNVRWPLFGWSRSNYGTMNLYIGDSRGKPKVAYTVSQFKWVVAHEFGHLLGIRDNYSSKNKVTSIFNVFGTKVQAVDIVKVLRAFYTNKVQGW